MKLNEIITESFDDPLPYSAHWDDIDVPEDELDDHDGNSTYPARVQTVDFMSPDGNQYMWYAKQNMHNDKHWEIVFGIKKGKNRKGNDQLDIGKTGTGNQMRVFSTVLEITQEFVEYFEYEVHHLYFTADKDDGMSRQKLYSRILRNHTPDGFELESVNDAGNEIQFTLTRVY